MSKTANPKSSGNFLSRLQARLDMFQQKHHAFGFPFAVIKKYSDDDAGYQAALITYYGFLSLFPLLLVATTIIDFTTRRYPELRDRLLTDINTYLPVIGEQLQQSIHVSSKTGAALLIGLLVTLYGARGIADVVRNTLDRAWAVPRVKRTRFPNSIIKSFGLLLGAGFGLLLTTALTSYATARFSQSIGFRLIPVLVAIGFLYLVFLYIFMIGTSRRHSFKDIRLGAITAAIGLLLLQSIGSYLLVTQMRNLSGLYGQFALVLSIIFWIYLQAQVFVYAIEINVVHTYKLWPRSLTQEPTTSADRKAYRLYAEKEAYRPKPEEEIDVTFQTPKS